MGAAPFRYEYMINYIFCRSIYFLYIICKLIFNFFRCIEIVFQSIILLSDERNDYFEIYTGI